jgi:hypothetical protein
MGKDCKRRMWWEPVSDPYGAYIQNGAKISQREWHMMRVLALRPPLGELSILIAENTYLSIFAYYQVLGKRLIAKFTARSGLDRRASYRCASHRRVSYKHASYRRVSHRRASLTGVHLRGAHLIGVHLIGVHLL